ncbi:MAG TPA: hypothetical protein VGQ93_17295 [Lysobacter sp.]|jgi:hypothetical protein|nr:hypothetical protein [Lysobacter sp.]
MNRKLRNSLSAFTASGAALAIALMVAVPAGTSPVLDVVSQTQPAGEGAMTHLKQQTSKIDSLAQAVALSAEIAATSALAFEADQDMDAHPQSRAPHKGSRHRRQTVVMPYFSFSPRG